MQSAFAWCVLSFKDSSIEIAYTQTDMMAEFILMSVHWNTVSPQWCAGNFV